MIRIAIKSFKFGKMNLKMDLNGNKARATKNSPTKKQIILAFLMFLNS
jgi:hypothetical protein